ncbi:hypothetical protein ACIA2T_36765 [Amycolatopsis japonica]|uniref:hypothetical protein n=1 Tax=Amycolatopsis japonica TaxID=208439 RepID=UPI0037B90FFB
MSRREELLQLLSPASQRFGHDVVLSGGHGLGQLDQGAVEFGVAEFPADDAASGQADLQQSRRKRITLPSPVSRTSPSASPNSSV